MDQNLNILVVDDDRQVIVWLAALLRRFGFTVSVAEDGIQAMAQTRQHRPGLILCDVNMPAGNGIFVLECLKKNPDFASIPVILMTGDVNMDPSVPMRMGADACLSKNSDAYQLVATIRSLMGLEPLTSPVSPATGAVPVTTAPDLVNV
jgi:CheY-like chemotaxis protein